MGATGAQYNVPNILAAHTARSSQRMLGDRRVGDHSSVTGLLDGMEKLGWVRPYDHPTDRPRLSGDADRSRTGSMEKGEPVYLAAIATIAGALSLGQT
ncbi:MAG: hypothetical protein ABI222_04315 [Opitutaceae bacterium]